MTTYTDTDVTINSAGIYSDASATQLVESITLTKVATGTYEASELTYTSYTLGQSYYLKVNYTPSGDSARDQITEIRIVPQGQAGGAASVTDTDCDGAHIQAPLLRMRVGLGVFREEDFENYTTADALDRKIQEIAPPSDSAAHDIHLLISSPRAGAPVAIEFIIGQGTQFDPYGGSPQDPFVIQAPRSGYRSGEVNNQFLLRRSTDFSLDSSVVRTRPGYRIQRTRPSGTDATYSERIPVDSADGTLRTLLFFQDNFYSDAATPVAVTGHGHAVVTYPYTSTTQPIPQWVHMKGRTIWVNGVDADYRCLIYSAVDGALKAKTVLTDPGNPTLTDATGGTVTATTWYGRVRWKDSDTGTESGPNSRTGSAGSVAISNGSIKVDVSSIPARATHWQFQMATTDTPASYEIAYTVKDAASGGNTISDSTGWVPKANTTGYIQANASSGDRFEYRSVSGVAVYRHANPPTKAAHVAHYKGRAVYAGYQDTWLVISESDNPEHFYNDNSSPHEGFNTFRGEDLVDAVVSPCTALAATEAEILFFMQSGVVVYEGSFVLDVATDSTAQVRGRDARAFVIAQDSIGSISPAVQVVDHEAYFVSAAGPAVFSGGRVLVLDRDAIVEDWKCRNPVYGGRSVIGYDPDRGQVHFSYVTADTFSTGFPDRTLVWNVHKRLWASPWNLHATSWTLHRLQDAGSSNLRGTRLLFGGPYGNINEFGYGWGDGVDGSSTDCVDTNSSSDTGTTVTVTGAGWTADEFIGCSLVLTDRTTGRMYYRTIKDNTTDTITWEGSITDSGGGWQINIGGIPSQFHTVNSTPGREFILTRVQVQLSDQMSVVA